jgi:hypothetical protein
MELIDCGKMSFLKTQKKAFLKKRRKRALKIKDEEEGVI